MTSEVCTKCKKTFTDVDDTDSIYTYGRCRSCQSFVQSAVDLTVVQPIKVVTYPIKSLLNW